jgi:hypothetical protein
MNRANERKEVNIQTNDTVRILESLLIATVPHNIVAGFRHGGVSLDG